MCHVLGTFALTLRHYYLVFTIKYQTTVYRKRYRRIYKFRYFGDIK